MFPTMKKDHHNDAAEDAQGLDMHRLPQRLQQVFLNLDGKENDKVRD